MSENLPLNPGERFALARVINNLMRANVTVNNLAQLQFPLTPDYANVLLSSEDITLYEYHALTSSDIKNPTHTNTALKILDMRKAYMERLREFGTSLLHQNRPEAIPMLLATDNFLDEDIQTMIIDENLMRGDRLEVMTRAYDLMDHGGAIIFPTFSEEHDSIAVIHNPDNVPFFRKYTGHVLDSRVLDQRTPAEVVAAMIGPHHRSR